MGVEIECEEFIAADYARFEVRLAESVVALEELLARPDFGRGPASLGAELELHLVDPRGRPAPVNRAVLADACDPRLAPEMDSFNLELNAVPVALAGASFSALAEQLEDALRSARRAAAVHGARLVTIGLLPTLEEIDLGRAALSDFRRYRALSAAVRGRREKPFSLRIEGDDVLETSADDVTFEGANTSFQIHLRVAPEGFARTYNAAQLATAIALAVSTNSPLFLGKRLWEETRIPLFRQSVDDRCQAVHEWSPARVSFGHGWVRQSAAELFTETVALYDPLLPVMTVERPLDVIRAGGVPALRELRLHNGTVWRWNRPIYDDADGGHLRIEFRAMPSGPTVRDMVANAAFVVGLTLGLAPTAEDLVSRITFGQARQNFYDAARRGLDAMLVWPSAGRTALVRARELVVQLLPLARLGLVLARVDAEDANRWLSIIERRCACGTTGARWQRRVFDHHCRTSSVFDAAGAMLEAYMRESISGKTVDAWEMPSP
jgi:gamma-glutamyl:cysteine ligase YbdK (ATP-grasp superfamily)